MDLSKIKKQASLSLLTTIAISILIISCTETIDPYQEQNTQIAPYSDVQKIGDDIPSEVAIPKFHKALRTSMEIIRDSTEELGIRNTFVDTLFLTHQEYIEFIRQIGPGEQIYRFSARDFFWHSYVLFRNEVKEDTLSFYGVANLDVSEDYTHLIPYANPDFIERFARVGQSAALLEYSKLHAFKEEFMHKITKWYIRPRNVRQTLLRMEDFIVNNTQHYLRDSVVEADTLLWHYFTGNIHRHSYMRGITGESEFKSRFDQLWTDYYNYRVNTELDTRKKVMICLSDLMYDFRRTYNLEDATPTMLNTFRNYFSERGDSCKSISSTTVAYH